MYPTPTCSSHSPPKHPQWVPFQHPLPFFFFCNQLVPPAKMLKDLVDLILYRPHTDNHSCSELAMSWSRRQHFMVLCQSSSFCILSTLLSWGSPSHAWKGIVDMAVPFRAEHPTVPHAQCVRWLWTASLTDPRSRKKLLWPRWRAALLCKHLEGIFSTCPFSKTIEVGSPLVTGPPKPPAFISW